MRTLALLAFLPLLLGSAPSGDDAPSAHEARAAWELAVHTALLKQLDPVLACGPEGQGRNGPPWLHLTFDVRPDGSRSALRTSGLAAPSWLRRCLEGAVPSRVTPHADPADRTVVRTLFLQDGLAEEGFPGPQRLRIPLLLDGAPDAALSGVVLRPSNEPPTAEPRRLTHSSFVLSPGEALMDLRRRLWLQALRDEVHARLPELRGCGLAGRVAVGIDGRGHASLVAPDDACGAGLIAEIQLHPSPDGAPGRLALDVQPDSVTRAEWPGDGDVLLSVEDEAMVVLAKERASTATADCYARLVSTPFRSAWSGELLVGVVVGSAGEAGDVLTDGGEAVAAFARCVADAHRPLGFPAPKDGVPVLLLVNYVFSVE